MVQAEEQIDKERGLAHVVVQVVDENGVPVLSDDEVTCAFPVRQAAWFRASNNTDMVIIPITNIVCIMGVSGLRGGDGEEGEIEVEFTAPWLKPVSVSLKAK